ncbi:MAG TPA: ATP-binding protein [Flavobacteriales bacterium]|jgi:nicotinamide riboside kinase|nr:ATP-binding protein [Flavobacteriales bacterium]
MLRIVVTGPESSGKTTLAEALAAHYGTIWVHEAARSYLNAREAFGTASGYVERDLLAIAELQLRIEEDLMAMIKPEEPQLIICDTDLITIRIWGEDKFGRSDPWIVQQTHERSYDLWLLCAPDMPWEPDPLREDPHGRDRLFAIYRHTLEQLGKPFIAVRGTHAERMQEATAAIDAASKRVKDAGSSGRTI